MQDQPDMPRWPLPERSSESPKAAQSESAAPRGKTAKPDEHRLVVRLRNYLLAGLMVVGPVGITLYLAWRFITLVDGWVKPYVPSDYNPDTYLNFDVPGVGLVFAVLLLIIVGALAANLLSRVSEVMLGRMPIVRNVYQGLQQIFEAVVTATSTQGKFQKVAMMQFPSQGIWSIVFITAETSQDISKEISKAVSEEELISVFMPTGMLPPSGFVCFVPRRNVKPIHMSVEDAAKVIISAGMVNPEAQSKAWNAARRPKNGQGQPATPIEAPPSPPSA